MNASKQSNYVKLPIVEEEDINEFENSRNQTRLEDDMFEIEKRDATNDLAKVAQQIQQSTELQEPEKHNLMVDLNAADWELSRARRIFSIVVLVLLTLG